MTAFAFTSTDPGISTFALADKMERKGSHGIVDYHSHPAGWKMERGAKCLHCSVLPSHTLEGADMQFHCRPYGNRTNCQGEKELMRHKTSHIQLKQVNFCALDIHSFTSF